MENLDKAIREIGEAHGFAFMLATPSEENMRADDADKKLLWLDIQQSGNFTTVGHGYRLDAHLRIHFMDDQEWDEEGEMANSRKNWMLREAFECYRALNSRLMQEGEYEITGSPAWQVVYNSNDRNKIDIMLEIDVIGNVIHFC